MFPEDLIAWRWWQRRQNPLRLLRSALRPDTPARPWLAVRGTSPRLLVALDATTPTQLASLVRPLELLGENVAAAVLAPSRLNGVLPGEWTWTEVDGAAHYGAARPEVLDEVASVLAVGHYLPVGAQAEQWAHELSAQLFVVQHGLLTPHAPPLPRGAHLFSFTDADAEFAASGRTDVAHTTVGSQLLWAAASGAGTVVSDRPVYLGQLHGAELPRAGKARAAGGFCRETGAEYRPHPAETDLLSRLQHRRWASQGIAFDRSGLPLAELGRPVVSAFSTGVLEAAARGVPAWVHYPRPPVWLSEFWERYGMLPWGGDPTPSPIRPATEPAQAIANHLLETLGARP
ncbi:RNA-binding protein [Sinomonas sp. P10A9]|uniref:RNA-binding protein n=1 Tax=Sinomonas puerhi TaxID=3238584 RepID=A0AB39L1N0_9MICC